MDIDDGLSKTFYDRGSLAVLEWPRRVAEFADYDCGSGYQFARTILLGRHEIEKLTDLERLHEKVKAAGYILVRLAVPPVWISGHQDNFALPALL
jgi:hypothetical protein